MAFEAQWPVCRRAELAVPGLPAPWSGVSVLHLSDVHAGHFATNERSLEKAVDWAAPLEPDLVFLTGDMLGDPRRSARAAELLARLQPPLGMFAVTGNHEYGLGKGPLAKARDVGSLWTAAGVTLLRDSCVALPDRGGSRLVLCGADYLTGGFGLLGGTGPGGRVSLGETGAPGCAGAPAAPLEPASGSDFPILLIHVPPSSDSPLAAAFSLAFAGHTHGGQLRVPSPSGLRPLVNEEGEYLSGVHEWGGGRLVVSRGVGTSFLPFRLLTRPEATLWRLV
jgi:predicted MPP superfamily phosphohydrolase